MARQGTRPAPRGPPYGYVILAAAVLIQLIGWGTFGSFGVFFSPLQKEFLWSRASISGVASTALLVHGLFSIVAGNLSDRLGPRLVVTACGVIFALGAFLTSHVHYLWQLYLTYGVVLGIGVSAFDVVVLSTIVRWFTRTRGVMTGIVKAGAGLGHLTVPVLAAGVIAAQGWRSAYTVLAAVCIVIIVSAAQFLRRDPGTVGRDVPHPGHSEPVAAEEGLTLAQASRRWQFWSLLAAYFTLLFSTYTVQVHIAPHAIDLGNSVTQAAGVLSVIGAAGVAGRFVMGGVGDRVGTRRAMIFCFGLLCTALLVMAFIGQRWMLYLIIPFYGFAHGGSYSLISPMVASLFGTGSHGAIYGLIIFGGTIGGAIGPVLAGYLFDTTGSYRPVFLILSVVAAVGLLLLALLRPVIVKEHGL
jgi:MFS family permease